MGFNSGFKGLITLCRSHQTLVTSHESWILFKGTNPRTSQSNYTNGSDCVL